MSEKHFEEIYGALKEKALKASGYIIKPDVVNMTENSSINYDEMEKALIDSGVTISE